MTTVTVTPSAKKRHTANNILAFTKSSITLTECRRAIADCIHDWTIEEMLTRGKPHLDRIDEAVANGNINGLGIALALLDKVETKNPAIEQTTQALRAAYHALERLPAADYIANIPVRQQLKKAIDAIEDPEFVAQAFNQHCKDLHNADFEVCPHPMCHVARTLESSLAATMDEPITAEPEPNDPAPARPRIQIREVTIEEITTPTPPPSPKAELIPVWGSKAGLFTCKLEIDGRVIVLPPMSKSEAEKLTQIINGHEEFLKLLKAWQRYYVCCHDHDYEAVIKAAEKCEKLFPREA